MASMGDLLGGIGIGGGGGGGGIVQTAISIILGVIILGCCGGGLWFFAVKKKKWNLKVEFKIPRNIRKVRTKEREIKVIGTLNKEWGRGAYDSKNGVVLLKRAKKKPVPMKPFDIKSFLSSDNILTVVQVGIDDYRPVSDDSYIQMEDSRTGDKFALLNAKIDTSEGKSWRNSYERERKNTYALTNFLREHGQLISIGIIILFNFIGFAILWKQVRG